MVVPFGVSVGDFIAGIKLIHDLAEALKARGGSSSDYQDLVRELYLLERALIAVKTVIDPSNPESRPFGIAHVEALKQVVGSCRHTVDEFLRRNRKYASSLTTFGSGSKWKDMLKKIEWSQYKKEDVQSLRWKIHGHTTAINMMLLSMQMDASGRTNTLIQDTNDSLAVMKTRVTGLQQLMMEVLASNLRIFEEVRNMNSQIPAQVLLQDPVLFWDARGHFAPFHLEFVNSAEAFLAVLRVRFKDGGGQKKIDHGEFAVADAGTKKDIDLVKAWNRCFRPGQKVNMSMIFDLTPREVENACPACGHVNFGNSDVEIKCDNCDRYYQRITEVDSNEKITPSRYWNKKPLLISVTLDKEPTQPSGYVPTVKQAVRLDTEAEIADENLVEYLRVRVRTRDFVKWVTGHEQAHEARVFANGSILQVHNPATLVYFRADRSIAELARNRITYYEFKILAIGYSWELSVGFCTMQKFHLAMYIGNSGFKRRIPVPGVYDAWITYTNVASQSVTNGDTCGCGYDIDTGTMFYTLNNQLAAYSRPVRIEIQEWQPIVTVGPIYWSASAVLKTNFGYKPFQYDLSRRDYDLWTRLPRRSSVAKPLPLPEKTDDTTEEVRPSLFRRQSLEMNEFEH